MMKSKILWLILISFALSGCGQKVQAQKAAGEVIPVKVSKIELRDLDRTLEYVGDIKADSEVLIYPKASGKIMEKVKEDGEAVKKSEVICYIDRDEVGLKFEKAPVESSLDGVIGRVYVDIGQNVGPQTAVALVVSAEKVKIDFNIPEKYFAQVSPGQEAKISVDAYPGKDFTGMVAKISPVIDLNTRSFPIEITVDNKRGDLKSGMFARVSLILERHKKVPVILKEAVMGKPPNFYVYAIEDKKATAKKISLGLRQGPYFEITSGLKEGDLVVIMGQQRLFEGAEVAPEEDSK